jgi:hypothetical protein
MTRMMSLLEKEEEVGARMTDRDVFKMFHPKWVSLSPSALNFSPG